MEALLTSKACASSATVKVNFCGFKPNTSIEKVITSSDYLAQGYASITI